MADGDGAQSGADGTQSGTGETTTTTGSESNGTGEGTQSGTTSTPDTADLERRAAEADSLRDRMKAADQRAARFEQELKQLKEKDMPAAEKLQRDFEESQKQVETLQSTNQKLALQVAFLSDNTYTWHNPDRALKLVDLSQVEIDADGKVSGLKDALKALATSDPYLIKKEVSQEENRTPPGTAPGNNGANGSGKPKATALQSRFPVMRTRVKPQ
jgi:hypothetical protein